MTSSMYQRDAYQRAADAAEDRLESAPARLLEAYRLRHERVEQVRDNPNVSESYRTSQIKRADEEVAATIAEIEADARAARETLNAYGARPASRGREVDLAAELQFTRATSNVQRSLDSGVTIDRLIRDAADAGDAATLLALRVEVGRAKPFQPGDLTTGEGDNERAKAGLLRQVDVALARHGGADHSSPARARVLAGPLEERAEAAVEFARASLRTGQTDLAGSLGMSMADREFAKTLADLEGQEPSKPSAL
jgi:hypothetical protein